MSMEYFLESCCTDVEQIRRAQEAGARRIELCEKLAVGGVTPSAELLKAAISVAKVPVNVLVRPRGGDFVFSAAEADTMLRDIELCREAGAAAVVIGALDSRGDVDMPLMRRLCDAASGMSVTFHRAFDVCADPLAAFEDVLALGCDRLLTSGHESDAFKGRFFIAELVERAAGRIIVMPGCGVRRSNIARIAADTGAVEFHASSAFFD
ncbi:MAG: copper homeostasis protein CutC [Candidatus Cryptobacteroides sp.]|nr:copper homeostasis protein CutC [Bacteroidales bacterium]MDY4631433.1 copper homeostasis protein CutC [Candidatus Cryptobacteroides sp.]MDY5744373.1 copper homeostasis protein CutC [Candidatus Cryptobacteroides sp.]